MFVKVYFDYNYNTWMLIDTKFRCKVQSGNSVIAIIDNYPKEEVLSSLKIYFGSFYRQYRFKMLTQELANSATYAYYKKPSYYAELEKYAPCIQNHLKKLEYIGK